MEDACEAYAAAGLEPPREKLTAVGDEGLARGHYHFASRAYAAAGVAMPRDKLVACGDKAMEDDIVAEVFPAYLAAGAKEGIAACGRSFLGCGSTELALRAFRVAGVKPPEDRLVVCAVRAFDKGKFRSARLAYKAAGVPMPRDRLLMYGREALARRRKEVALDAFRVVAAAELGQEVT